MKRTLATLLTAALCSCGGGTPPANSARAPATNQTQATAETPLEGRPMSLHERSKIEPLLRAAQEVRSLRFAHDVPMQVQTAASIRHSMESELEDEDILKNRNFYVALGLLPDDVDVRELLLDVLGEQVVGYYDTKLSRLTLRDDVMNQSFAFGPSTRSTSMDSPAMVIVHELVHALQDQNLGLSAAEELDRSDDAGNAFHAVVEGDATLAMIAHLMHRNGVPLYMLAGQIPMLRQMLSSQPQQATPGSEALMHAPPIVRVPLLSSYVDGMLFCITIYAARGGWEAVNQAHRTPPVSTEQILHPEKFLAGELPDAITLPEFGALAAAGWRTLTDDTVGELEMGVYFGLATHADSNKAAAAGWGGDRVRVLQNAAGDLSAVWFTTWDNEAEAVEAEAAARAIFPATPAARAAATARSHHELRVGRALLIVRNLSDAQEYASVESAFRAFATALPAQIAAPSVDAH